MLNDVFLLARDKQFGKASALSLQACDTLAARGQWRYAAYMLTHRARYLAGDKRPDEAVRSLMQANALVDSLGLSDFRNILYEKIIEIARQAGRPAIEQEYARRLAALQDNDSRHAQLMNVVEMENALREDYYSSQLAQNELRRSRQKLVIIFLGVMAALTALFLAVVVNRNRRLRRAHRQIYENLQQLMGRQGAPPEKARAETAAPAPDGGERALLERVNKVLETSEAVFNPDFGIEELAAMTGSKSRTLSALINKHQGCNFNTLLGHRRIREACRRMSTPGEYGQLTLESIAESVGIRSRSHFTLLFKKYAGMRPSEYLRIARDKTSE